MDMVLEKMMQRIWGSVSLHTDIPMADFEAKVRHSVRLTRSEFLAALLAGAINVRQSCQDAAEPETIVTFFPSTMILGPSNMILADTDLEHSG